MHYDPQERHIELMRHAPRALTYREGEDFAAWQVKAREKLTELLGLPLEMRRGQLPHRVETREGEDGASRIRFVFASEPDVDVSCQSAACPSAPCGESCRSVICLQGHSTGMHISLGASEVSRRRGDHFRRRPRLSRARSSRAARRRWRWISAASASAAARRDGPACHQTAMQALLLGRTLIGERCWDVSRAIDAALAHFPQDRRGQDRAHGQFGRRHCHDATPRRWIRASRRPVPSSRVLRLSRPPSARSSHCICNYVPGIMKYFDMGDLAGADRARGRWL